MRKDSAELYPERQVFIFKNFIAVKIPVWTRERKKFKNTIDQKDNFYFPKVNGNL